MRALRMKDFLWWANSASPEALVTVTLREDGSARLSAVTRDGKNRTVLEFRRAMVLRNEVE